MEGTQLSRRVLLGAAGGAALGAALPGAGAEKTPALGLELYSVRDNLSRDLMGTVRAVAKMGYEVVEFYSPYYQWTTEYAREVRRLLDELHVRCLSTHNSRAALEATGLPKAIELNQIPGSTSIVMASPGRISAREDWKRVAEILSSAAEALKPLGMRA
ncbi:MAG: TIM barrel protein, partial [Armatimonadetes bacterium]|nr:TIM barrel protein [Armatimonadota bacterium]